MALLRGRLGSYLLSKSSLWKWTLVVVVVETLLTVDRMSLERPERPHPCPPHGGKYRLKRTICSIILRQGEGRIERLSVVHGDIGQGYYPTLVV